jgi:prefoldin subunit 5
MSKKISQKIAVLLTMAETDKTLILYGIKISSLFSKELCLVSHSMKKMNTKNRQIKQKLNGYISSLERDLPALEISTLVFRSSPAEMPELLADEHETILIIIDSAKYRIYSKAVYNSPIPFLFVNPQAKLSSLKRIILPVDLRKGNSETALWSSYFGRFNNSEIFIVAANHKDYYERKQVAANISLIDKLFQKLSVRHKIYRGKRSSLHNSYEALEVAISSESDMLVILGSSTITLLDIIIGLPEKKIITKAGNLPVLLINSKRDNYLLCH